MGLLALLTIILIGTYATIRGRASFTVMERKYSSPPGRGVSCVFWERKI
jgi:hypothetical protein